LLTENIMGYMTRIRDRVSSAEAGIKTTDKDHIKFE